MGRFLDTIARFSREGQRATIDVEKQRRLSDITLKLERDRAAQNLDIQTQQLLATPSRPLGRQELLSAIAADVQRSGALSQPGPTTAERIPGPADPITGIREAQIDSPIETRATGDIGEFTQRLTQAIQGQRGGIGRVRPITAQPTALSVAPPPVVLPPKQISEFLERTGVIPAEVKPPKVFEAEDLAERKSRELFNGRAVGDLNPQEFKQLNAALLADRTTISAARGTAVAKARRDLPLLPKDRKDLINPDELLSNDNLVIPPAGLSATEASNQGFVFISPQERKAFNESLTIQPILETAAGLANIIITATTPGEAIAQFAGLSVGAISLTNSEAVAYKALLQALLGLLVRVLGG